MITEIAPQKILQDIRMEGNQKDLEGKARKFLRRSIMLTKLIISQSIRKHMEDRGVILKHGRGSKTVTSE
jgi:hypothetical protein